MDFSLSSYFNAFDVDKDYQIEFSDVDSKLESITDSLANNPESLNFNQELLEDLIELTHGFRELEEKKRHQLAYLVTSSLNAVGQSYGNMLQSGDFHDNVDTIKSTLERYGYLMFVLLKYLGKRISHKLVMQDRRNLYLEKSWLGGNQIVPKSRTV